jgi:heptosyltransferase-1
MRVLIVKLSSLGDVVHALPAVTDALRARPGLEVHWAVEEAYAAIPALHPAVARVIPVALRRWRAQPRAIGREIRSALRALRESTYDLIVDAQGLIKSAVVARIARGPVVGFDRSSVREGAAALLYGRGVRVAQALHAIDRQRALFAAALGYASPREPIDYGVARERSGATGLVLAHGTTWDNKRWPQLFWAAIARRCLARGERVTLPWGNDDERRRALEIATLAPGACVADALDLRGITKLLARSAAVVSVDSGIGHLAAALGVPTLALYGPTDAGLTGCRGDRATNLASDFDCAPCRSRRCRYRGEAVFVDGQRIEPPCFARLTPELVWQRLLAWTSAA